MKFKDLRPGDLLIIMSDWQESIEMVVDVLNNGNDKLMTLTWFTVYHSRQGVEHRLSVDTNYKPDEEVVDGYQIYRDGKQIS